MAAGRARGLLAAVALAGLAAAGCGGGDCDADVHLEGLGSARLASFCADVAATAEARRTGLRGRAPLGPDEALLLVYPVEDPGGVCIRNTGVAFPIDALFVDARGMVVRRELGVPANDPTVRCSEAPTDRVLEVAAGAAPAGTVAVAVE